MFSPDFPIAFIPYRECTYGFTRLRNENVLKSLMHFLMSGLKTMTATKRPPLLLLLLLLFRPPYATVVVHTSDSSTTVFGS